MAQLNEQLYLTDDEFRDYKVNPGKLDLSDTRPKWKLWGRDFSKDENGIHRYKQSYYDRVALWLWRQEWLVKPLYKLYAYRTTQFAKRQFNKIKGAENEVANLRDHTTVAFETQVPANQVMGIEDVASD